MGTRSAEARDGRKADRPRKGQLTRGRLLEAAFEVIGRKGYAAATMDEIAQAAGVSKGVAYYHFKNKAEIASTVLTEAIDQLVALFEQVRSQGGSAHGILTGMLSVFATMIYEKRALAQFATSEMWLGGGSMSEAVHDQLMRIVDLVCEQIERGQADGSVRTDIDASFQAVSIIGMVAADALYALGAEGAADAGKETFVARVVGYAGRASAA